MSMETVKDTALPFRVVQVNEAGESLGFCKGFKTLEDATESAGKRDGQAEELGISARYAAIPTPPPSPDVKPLPLGTEADGKELLASLASA